jgi:hypothetical protein
MDAAALRLISLIPDRSPRAQSGSVFSPSEAAACRHPDRMSYLTRFLHWLGPLDPMSKEDQQILGVRSSGGRPMMAGEEAGEELEMEMDETDDAALDEDLNLPEAGTVIAQEQPATQVGG